LSLDSSQTAEIIAVLSTFRYDVWHQIIQY
jgi:hypothetical protein